MGGKSGREELGWEGWEGEVVDVTHLDVLVPARGDDDRVLVVGREPGEDRGGGPGNSNTDWRQKY